MKVNWIKLSDILHKPISMLLLFFLLFYYFKKMSKMCEIHMNIVKSTIFKLKKVYKGKKNLVPTKG